MKHISVLKETAIEALDIKPDGVYVDGTLGRAGHSKQIASLLTTGHLTCFDLDTQAIEESKEVLSDYLDKVTIIHDNFANMGKYINSVDGILLDLGVSSPQFDDGSRGFSYRFDSRLDMRMNQEQELDAYTVVNTYEPGELVRIFYTYGEEKFSKPIVKKIIENRPIETTGQLVEVIKSALPAKVLNSKGHPAKKIFQALRIEVNQELNSLEKALQVGIECLKPGGKFVIITFHSLEDRIVKEAFNKVSKPPKGNRRQPVVEEVSVDFEHELIKVTQDEIEVNNRAHSAKMRVLTRKVKSHG